MTRDIIVPLDGSAQADAAIPHAAALALKSLGNLHLVRVHVPILTYMASESPLAIPDPAWDERVRVMAENWLVRIAGEVRSRVKVPVSYELRVGNPAEEIIAAATERGAHAIVCTTHGHGGWAPQWVGSVTDAIIRHSPCPVLAMSETAVHRVPAVDRILVPLDGSDIGEKILPMVQEIALASDAVVDLYRVVAPPFIGDALDAMQSGRVDPFGVDPIADAAKHELERTAQALIVHGIHATSTVEVATNPTRAILDRIALTDPDLLAMTTHGRGLSRLFMGSVADKVLRAGGRPALCWRPPAEAEQQSGRAAVCATGQEMFATSVSAPTA